ncbi:hypothetical protein CFP56_033406 [Quercus suber]|uniref:Uncharacterized protein n=1 Tax=Quercus suber TaxID=58331 RepID=A0AAW0LSU3_QUESU
MLRFINVAPLCIQENAANWPTISDVILMFNKELRFYLHQNNQHFHLPKRSKSTLFGNENNKAKEDDI